MAALTWDGVGNRVYETGVDHGVLYIPDNTGAYASGVAWNGLVTVTESPSGAEATKQYADNIPWLNLVSVEEFGGTIEAFTYPPEFEQFDGSLAPEVGVYLTQQNRKTFGLSYRTLLGNDLEGASYGYKLHVVYGALATPSERARATVNDTPEPLTLSWQFSTTPVEVGTIGGVAYRPTAHLVVNSTEADPTALATLEALLYGTNTSDPELPLPADLIALFA